MTSNNKYDLKQARFFTTVDDFTQLPECSKQEIVVCGRSNVGKSTLINTITTQKRLAFSSKTPGRTQYINYFSIDKSDTIFLVDLPGYGYAKVPPHIRQHWDLLLNQYFTLRKQIAGVLIIMDIRHPLTVHDCAMLQLLYGLNKPIHIILSKADKLSQSAQKTTFANTKDQLAKIYPTFNTSMQVFANNYSLGVEDLNKVLKSWIR